MTRLSKQISTPLKLMGRMLDRCDVDMNRLAAEHLGLTLASTLRTCEICRNADSCATWLAATAGETNQKPPSFCPNAKTLEAMKSVFGEDTRSNQTGNRAAASKE